MKKRLSVVTIIFWLILLVYLSVGMVIFITRQVCVKGLHIDNEYVQFIFKRNKTLLDEAALYAGHTSNAERVDWEALYPFEDGGDIGDNYDNENNADISGTESSLLKSADIIDGYTGKADRLKEHVTNYVEKYHPLQLYMKWLAGGYNLVTMGREAALAYEDVYIANDEWLYAYNIGELGLTDEQKYADENLIYMADEVKDFYDYLSENDIGFIFATVGSKPSPYDNDIPTPNVPNKNTEYFLSKLDERGVPNLYLSQMMPREADKWYEMYYHTDGHWNERAGIWASGVFAEYLNENADFSFDLNRFDISQYDLETREHYYRGGTGRDLSPFLCETEPHTRFIPKIENYYKYAHYGDGKYEWREGSFVDVFYDNAVYEEIATWSEADFYDQTKGNDGIANDDLFEIVNEKTPDNADKKILILRDSFAANLTPYLSTDVGEIDLIYNPKFTGSIRAYIEKNDIDAVIMLLVESNIRSESSIDYFGSGYHFDLR